MQRSCPHVSGQVWLLPYKNGIRGMKKIVYLIIPSIFLVSPSGSVAAPIDQYNLLQSKVAHRQAHIDNLNEEIGSVLTNKAKIDSSPEIREEEARSIAVRFPGLRATQAFSSQQFLEVLIAERQRQQQQLTLELSMQLKLGRKKACELYNKVKAAETAVYASPGWTKASLKQRMALRKEMADGLKNASADGDPCKLY